LRLGAEGAISNVKAQMTNEIQISKLKVQMEKSRESEFFPNVVTFHEHEHDPLTRSAVLMITDTKPEQRDNGIPLGA
jgi:hypothetical protein